MDGISFGLSFSNTQNSAWSFTPARGFKGAAMPGAAPVLHNTSEAFAADIARRISGAPMPGPEADKAQEAKAAEKSVYGVTRGDLKALEKALAGVIDKIIDQFGVKVGGIAQALIYKKVGEDEVTEQTLGDGLLDALKFIDKQFGPQEGDKLIEFMNGGINKELNAFFGNGKNEEFYASTGAAEAAAGASAVGGAMLGGWLEKTADIGSDAPGILDILKKLAKEMEERLQKRLQEVPPDAADGEISAPLAEAGVQAYAAQTAPAGFAPGALLDEAV